MAAAPPGTPHGCCLLCVCHACVVQYICPPTTLSLFCPPVPTTAYLPTSSCPPCYPQLSHKLLHTFYTDHSRETMPSVKEMAKDDEARWVWRWVGGRGGLRWG